MENCVIEPGIGTVDASGWTEVMVGGGISRETMENELLPTLVDYLNDEIVNDPDDEAFGYFYATAHDTARLFIPREMVGEARRLMRDFPQPE